MIKRTKNLFQLNFMFLLFWSNSAINPVQAKALVIASDEWCPYVCDNKSSPGFLLEIINEIAANKGIKIKFSFMPLARALKLANTNKVDILLAVTPQHVADFNLQQSQLSFGGFYNDFYVQANQSWRFHSITDLDATLKNNAIIGTINGYHYGEQLNQLLSSNTSHVFPASGNSPLKKQLKMLQMGRLDILLDSRFTVQYQLKKLPHLSIIYAGTQGYFTPLFLGFSPLLTTKKIQQFDHGLTMLRESGRLKVILAKYGLNDWHTEILKPHKKNSFKVIGE